jgi:hypothetical protein
VAKRKQQQLLADFGIYEADAAGKAGFPVGHDALHRASRKLGIREIEQQLEWIGLQADESEFVVHGAMVPNLRGTCAPFSDPESVSGSRRRAPPAQPAAAGKLQHPVAGFRRNFNIL